MNSYSILLVDERIAALQREAAERHARPAQASTVRRVAAALTSLRGVLATPVAIPTSIIPTLDGYPTKG